MGSPNKKEQEATTVAKVLWGKVLVNFGFPRKLHFDQGRYFESKDLCKLAGIEKTGTTLYHPQGNDDREFPSVSTEHSWACNAWAPKTYFSWALLTI